MAEPVTSASAHPILASLSNAAPAIAMVAVIMLIVGGAVLIRRGSDTRQKGVLMIVCAVVVFANVLIWTV